MLARPRIAPVLRMAQVAQVAHVHDVARQGFGTGTNELYDRARPSYPAAALQFIHSSMSPSQATVIEPGAGTGIFSRLLLQPPTADYPKFDLKALVGVEPSAGMREAWDNGMSRIPKDAKPLTLRVVDGGFDDLSQTGLSKGTADAVIIAQAWHWCPDHEKALTEIADYLKPGAPLILIWNLESDSAGLHKSLRETYQPYDQGSPQYYRMLWRSMYETTAYKRLYSPKQEVHFPWEMGMTEDQVVDRVMSKSYMTMLKGDERDEAIAQIRQVIRQSDKEWIDKDNGVFKYRYTTDIVILRKI
ncbi:hypothetical protein CcaverHIS002_0604130 [Cutaneotrichosporon cavernicola]|uniref:Methyltransferase type 11 domain-containing protein n=1 Tax=Cutaneotrichosporon cavernicola TaxID=279322 RepID=A0AA48QXT4_9TREE|nr:uncharacterized protein CcaverHIS019_0603580 [Cutaneotrichosporon cavernicola]BEI86126.1 hypothetical protein CcaverHIS002_0604130 [Cutaneotrichosporon cavernicola]BEI93899.1 hypothetical protein CcaverHIS019_0603580 [Cutaneotrichosporon cavernicola]BEJ01677.1 hypothetical protein CcaverHIS631_0603590 [Cutaneotrichosporon cavernicola]BEJ09445.1 hypothetical protein CcaverHIS641_0603600 [Cutaneotrichosporon cavernicola]